MIRKHHHQPGRRFQLLQHDTILRLSAFLQKALLMCPFSQWLQRRKPRRLRDLCAVMSLWIICSPKCLWNPARGEKENQKKKKSETFEWKAQGCTLGDQGCFLLVAPCKIVTDATLPWLEVCFCRAGTLIHLRVAAQFNPLMSKRCWGITGNSKLLLCCQLPPQSC